jgi:hypothetical protein
MRIYIIIYAFITTRRPTINDLFKTLNYWPYNELYDSINMQTRVIAVGTEKNKLREKFCTFKLKYLQ